jgi:hypothetical protein
MASTYAKATADKTVMRSPGSLQRMVRPLMQGCHVSVTRQHPEHSIKYHEANHQG